MSHEFSYSSTGVCPLSNSHPSPHLLIAVSGTFRMISCARLSVVDFRKAATSETTIKFQSSPSRYPHLIGSTNLAASEFLSPEQWMNERDSNGTTPGAGGGGQITSYIAGGPFNPMADTTKTIGKDFAAYLHSVAGRLGK